ncbi:MAG: hypothetical protein ABFC96_17150, partial [Thermoguttaceae bacterium]
DGFFRFDKTEQDYRPQSDFLLSFSEEAKPQVGLRSYTTESQPVNPPTTPDWAEPKLYFQISVPPASSDAKAARPATAEAAPPADVLVLVDTSASMRDCRATRQSLAEVLHKLRPTDRFRLAAVDVSVRPIGDRWQPGGGREAEAALSASDQQFALGGTDLAYAFDKALELFEPKSSARRLVVYIGDGEVDSPTDTMSLVRRLGECIAKAHATPAIVLARESSDGRKLMDSLARTSGGLLFDVAGSGLGSHDLSAWLAAGLPSPERILRLSIEGVSPQDIYYPTAWLPGRTLHIFGRATPRKSLQVKLTTERDGKQHVRDWDLKVDPKQDDVFVGRLWAQHRIDELRRGRPADRDPEFETPTLQEKEITALAQEWSLLTPYTAFLVLESEDDYRRWAIDRRVRHRYWQPPDALVAPKLPERWLARVSREVDRTDAEVRARSLARVFQSVRDALDGGDPMYASRLLAAARDIPASRRAEYEKLLGKIRADLQRQSVSLAIRPYRKLFDPAAPIAAMPTSVDLPSLLAARPLPGSDFQRRHPYASQLLKEVRVRFRDWSPRAEDGPSRGGDRFNSKRETSAVEAARRRLSAEIGLSKPPKASPLFAPTMTDKDGRLAPMRLDDLQTLLAVDPKLNVVIDQRALSEADIRLPGMALSGYGHGRMSLRSFANYLLHQHGLTLVEEPYRLLITTPEHADSLLTTEVYPVADLFGDRAPSPEMLVDPYLDRRLAAEERIRDKLKRPIDVDFRDTPLTSVVDQLAKQMDDTVLIDHKALGEASIELDAKLTGRWHGVPASESLRWLLGNLGLTYVVADEALVITTPEEADTHLATRLHSGRGIVYEYATPVNQETPFSGSGRNRGRGGGMWGGMAGGMAMGGMAGGMGGFAGGTWGGPSVDSRTTGPIGVSSGGDASTPSASEPLPGEAAVGGKRSGPAPAFDAPGAMQPDVDSPTELIKSTVRPSSWDDVGGAGNVSYFEPTLDFVLSATDDVHEEIDQLFGRIRKLPPLSGPGIGWRPATLPHDSEVDLDSIITLLRSTVRPSSWDDVGGTGSISGDEPHGALVVSHTADVQDEVVNLLTQLRRSRFEAMRQDRPWQRSGLSPLRPVVAPWVSEERLPPLSALPEAKPEELALLNARRPSKTGLWEWRLTGPGRPPETIMLLLQPGRMEIRLPGCTLRAEGDAAAIAWPGLKLVELGNWGEDVRRLVDQRLPWLPHRSNEELARLFHVAKGSSGSVRLVPVALPANATTGIEAAFAGVDGLPSLWRSQLDGKSSGQLSADQRDARTLTMTDAAGKPHTRWQLVRYEPKGVTPPPLDADWADYLRLDRRTPQPAIDRPVWEAFEA